MRKTITAVIMAGGSGTRFWPASRAAIPKQFLRIISPRTMLEETLERIAPLVGVSSTYLVVNRIHEELTASTLAGRNVRILAEPAGRNTAPCIGLAALHAARDHPGEPMVVLPADHFVDDPDRFAQAITAAAELAAGGAIATVGATPTKAETGYGYIESSSETRVAAGLTCRRVRRFVEKPNRETAARFVSSGFHLWNCGVFAFTPETILREIAACNPELSEGLGRIKAGLGTPDHQQILEQVYPDLESISIDYSVMEKTAAPLWVVPVECGWSDVGSWEAVYELSPADRDQQGNRTTGSAAILDGNRNLVYSADGRLVCLLGVDDLVVIDTPGALLVAAKDRSQDIKRIPSLLKDINRQDLC